jgi:hypothetical protein
VSPSTHPIESDSGLDGAGTSSTCRDQRHKPCQRQEHSIISLGPEPSNPLTKIEIVEETEAEGITSSQNTDSDNKLPIECRPNALAVDDNNVTCNWPKCWVFDQRDYFVKTYPWLFGNKGKIGCNICKEVHFMTGIQRSQGMKVQLAKEWVNATIEGSGEDKTKILKSLRNKIYQHESSAAHQEAVRVKDAIVKNVLGEKVEEMQKADYAATSNIFRTAYYIAHNNRPFTDHTDLIDLQKLNGVKVGRVLHSNVICADIIEHISSEMKGKLMKYLIENKPPIAVLVDESTSLSKKSCLVVYIRCCTEVQAEPVTFFLDLVELVDMSAAGIATALLQCLEVNGLTEQVLSDCFICFASDGASVMLGKNNGVCAILKEKFPRLIGWHCLNHRLELSVHDAVKACTQVNHFKIFLDKLYSVYSCSPKHKRELEQCASELGQEVNKIGKVLDVRWVASSNRSVKAVWKSYEALHKHFISIASSRDSKAKDKATFAGLAKHLESAVFIQNLALMNDALQELSELSEYLQANEMTLQRSQRLITKEIDVFKGRKDTGGEYMAIASIAVENGVFCGVKLTTGKQSETIKQSQFYQALVDSMESRLLADNDKPLCNLIDTVFPSVWPDNLPIEYGEKELTTLCTTLLCRQTSQLKFAYREFKDSKGLSLPPSVKILLNTINTIPVSTAECERGFSRMNIICSPLRSTVTVKHISQLMFVGLVGPPLDLWKPLPYVKAWLQKGRRDATSSACMTRRLANTELTNKMQLWNII